MFSARELQNVWYGDRRPNILLIVLSMLFAAVSALRRNLYSSGFFSRKKLSVPVIVVGNITVGGTGKTPLVIALVEALRERGWKPGVISRGFAGSARGAVRVDENSDAAHVGDEAKLIFKSTHAPVAVSRDRARAGQSLIDAGVVDVIVADDGLQHYRLRRDIEICVIDGQRRFGNGRLLPAGPLRESEQHLPRFDFRVCNGGDARAGEIPMRLRGDMAVALDDRSKSQSLNTFAGRSVHAVAGIGNPDRFFAQLRAAGLDVIEHPFSDHHPFTAPDIEFGDEHPVLMTEKDAVKCRPFARGGTWSVPVRAEVQHSFFDGVEARLRRSFAR
ncbi:MAG TPA: tetraacyldisaccharide 4'-kinase [Rudaea sp.]|jgi:tetraacyldisaccharide 4'-kinase|nr:tetraacyldisaccharide 4'-kinase [Rudaea sp.]